MGFKDFPTPLRVKVAETSEEVECGSFSMGEHIELRHCRITLLKVGSAGGSEQLRLNIYTDEDYERRLYQSDWLELSDIEGLTTNWLGRVRFDFDRLHLNKDHTYYAAVESQSYTRDGEDFYIGFILDWPLQINSHAGDDYALKMAFYGYR